ncbi:hypothetical protein [Streptomyces sp. NPDC096033]
MQQDGKELLRWPYRDRRTELQNVFTDYSLTVPWTIVDDDDPGQGLGGA